MIYLDAALRAAKRPSDVAGHKTHVRNRTNSALALVIGLSSAMPLQAQQALERNQPPVAAPEPVSITIDTQDIAAADPTPFGIDLAGIRIIDGDDPAVVRPAKGITGGTTSIAPKGLPSDAIESALAPFLGRELSFAVISEIQAAIAGVYRDAGYPFVSVTLPPQEITSGVVQVRVIEFRAGNVTVEGTEGQGTDRIRGALRVEPGSRINADALGEDLTWLNRSPFQRLEGVFRPGSATALSDLEVMVTRTKPLRVFVGGSNSGSEASDRNRYFVGLEASLDRLNGAWMSYQMTGSEDLWNTPSRISPSSGNYPSYLSHAGRFVFPTGPRQALEIAPVFVFSREQADANISFENKTIELPILYRFALSNVLEERYLGDVQVGAAFKSLKRRTYFDDLEIASGEAEIFQVQVGWSHIIDRPQSRTVLDFGLVGNPGGVLSGNDSETWSRFTNGRVENIHYVYGRANVGRVTQIGDTMSWVTSATGLLSGRALPDTERLALGGIQAVRGYSFDDVSVDSGLIWRNELRLDRIQAGAQASVAPYLFADFGLGRDIAADKTTTISGIGVGADYSVADRLFGNANVGYALDSAGQTEAGDWAINLSIEARF